LGHHARFDQSDEAIPIIPEWNAQISTILAAGRHGLHVRALLPIPTCYHPRPIRV